MFSRNSLFSLKDLPKGMLNNKEKILKKKNSEIESRLFDKTRYYVIAVGKKSSIGESDTTKVRAYVYFNGDICFYSTQGRAYNQQEYIEYIDFVKQGIDKERYEWTDFWINRGQIILRDKKNNIYVDTEIIKPFSVKSKLSNKISDLSLKIFFEYLLSVNQDDSNKIFQLQDSYDKGILLDKVGKRIKNTPTRQLDEKDGEIIVRTKIEGYNYIMYTVKTLMNSNDSNKSDLINSFFNRVFYLEIQGYIGNEDDE